MYDDPSATFRRQAVSHVIQRVDIHFQNQAHHWTGKCHGQIFPSEGGGIIVEGIAVAIFRTEESGCILGGHEVAATASIRDASKRARLDHLFWFVRNFQTLSRCQFRVGPQKCVVGDAAIM